MKRTYLCFFLAVCLFICPASAQEDTEQQENAFGFPDKSVVKVIEQSANNFQDLQPVAPFPTCDDIKLQQQAQQELEKYVDDGNSSIIAQRKQKLLVKGLNGFSKLSHDKINATSHAIVAARLIELKINENLSDANIQVCHAHNNALKENVYLILYHQNQQTMVDIVNFKKGIPGFIFQE